MVKVTSGFLRDVRNLLSLSGAVVPPEIQLVFGRELGDIPPAGLADYWKFIEEHGIAWEMEPEAHYYLHPERDNENGVWVRVVRDGREYKASIPSTLFGVWRKDKNLDLVDFEKMVRRPELGNIFFGCLTDGESKLVGLQLDENPQPVAVVSGGRQCGKATRAILLEDLAKTIYETWVTHAGYVPWVEGGNSAKQNQARQIASRTFELALANQVGD